LTPYFAPGGVTTVSITIQDLFNLNDLLGKLLVPYGLTGGGGGGGIVGTIGPLMQIQLATVPRIATLDYLAANPQAFQQFLMKPTSTIQILLTATNGNRDNQAVNIYYEIKLDGKPYLITSKQQYTLNPGVSTNLWSWLQVNQVGKYEIIPHVEASPQDPNYLAVTLPTQTVNVIQMDIWLVTAALWAAILLPIIAVSILLARSILTKRRETKETEE
jgi:hypothetical protein